MTASYYFTMAPPNNGHMGTSHIVLCREVRGVLVLWESLKVVFIQSVLYRRFCCISLSLTKPLPLPLPSLLKILQPDPILTLHRAIGFGGITTHQVSECERNPSFTNTTTLPCITAAGSLWRGWGLCSLPLSLLGGFHGHRNWNTEIFRRTHQQSKKLSCFMS